MGYGDCKCVACGSGWAEEHAPPPDDSPSPDDSEPDISHVDAIEFEVAEN